MSEMVSLLADAIERDLDTVFMVDAAPSVIRRLRAEAVARRALSYLGEHYCPQDMYEAGRDAICDYTGLRDGEPRICDATALADVTFRAMMKAALAKAPSTEPSPAAA